MIRATGAALAFVALACAPMWAHASSVAQDRFAEAVELEADGQFEQAAGAFLSIAEKHPASPFAAPALNRAGRVQAVRLFAFDEALATLDTLVVRHPSHPKASSARQLARFLRDGRRSGDEALASFLLIRERPDLLAGPEDAVERLARITREAPDFAYAADVYLDWGVRLRKLGRIDEALDVFAEMRERFRGEPAGGQAVLETGQTLFDLGRFVEAAEWFDRTGELGGSAQLGRENAERARSHHSRRAVFRVALATLAAWSGLALVRTRWRRIDLAIVADALKELVVLVPAWAFLALVSQTASPMIRHPIYAMGIATAALLFFANLRLLTRPPGRAERRAHAVLTGLGILAIVYAALYRFDLVFALEGALRLGLPAG